MENKMNETRKKISNSSGKIQKRRQPVEEILYAACYNYRISELGEGLI